MLVLLALLAGTAPDSARHQPPRSIAELEVRINEILHATHTPGAGIAIVTRHRQVWIAGLGKADVASGRDATAETLFRIGSVSKAFTSLMVLLLEQEGKLQLDDPVARYIPEIKYQNRWEATDPVRIVNLLEHTTGWDDWAIKDYALNDSTLTLAQGLAFDPRTRTSRWRPGTRVAYCNSGPPVAAYLVQRVAGRPFEKLVRERLFLPIGMRTATYLRPDPGLPTATLYHLDGTTPFPYWHVLERPAGAINASARDMAAYLQFLLNRGVVRGRVILPREAIERMEHPQSSLGARAGLTTGYGLGLATSVRDSGLVWVGHTGGVPGGLTVLSYRPDQGVGYAFMINGGNPRAVWQIDRLVRAFVAREAEHPAPPAAAPLAATAHRWTGWYIADNPRVQGLYFLERLAGIGRLGVRDSGLTFTALLGRRARYVPVNATLYRRPNSPVATLALVSDSADGRPFALERVTGSLPVSYHRTPGPAVVLQTLIAALFLAITAATLLFALVWVPRRFWGRLRGAPRLGVRGWPLAAALAIVAILVLSGASRDDAITRFGGPTVWSLGVMLGTCIFPLASVAGLVVALRAPIEAVGERVRYYAITAGVLNVLASVYLAVWGVIGWRTWV
jgi:CubicO group peptidase (beta-lactamase class C family)